MHHLISGIQEFMRFKSFFETQLRFFIIRIERF